MSRWDPTGPVVVEVDGGAESLRAVDYAVAQAVRSGAELVLATPYAVTTTSAPITSVPTVLPSGDPLPAGLRAALERVQATAGPEIPVTLVTGAGPRFKVLPKVVQRARLLVIGVRGSRRLTAAQSLLTLASRVGCPTAVVPAAWQQASGAGGVVVGVDGTAVSTEALAFAFRAAAEREVPLTVVHSATAPRETVGGQHAERILSETLAGWADQYGEVELRRRVSHEPAVAALLKEAEHAELLVLGAQADTLGAFNPVARRVVASSKCPVVLVPHQTGVTEQELSRREVRSGSTFVPPTY